MMPKFAIVCTKAFYAGQGVSFEEGELKETTYSVEEALIIHQSMVELAYGDKECWAIMPYQDYHEKYWDKDTGPKAAERFKTMIELRNSCTLPHEFHKPESRTLSSSWICSKCKYELDANCASWYMNGRRDQKKENE